jgi:hypothetical protein
LARQRTTLSMDEVRRMTDADLRRMRQAKTPEEMATFIENFLTPPPPESAQRFSPYSSQTLAALQQVLQRLEDAADGDELKALLEDTRWQGAWKVLVGFLAEDGRRLGALSRYVARHMEKTYWTSGSEIAPPEKRKPKAPAMTDEERAERRANDPIYAKREIALAKARAARRQNRARESADAQLVGAGVA